MHAIDCTRIGDVIDIPCEVQKPDTYVAGLGPVLSPFTENNTITMTNNTMTNKKNNKQVKNKD